MVVMLNVFFNVQLLDTIFIDSGYWYVGSDYTAEGLVTVANRELWQSFLLGIQWRYYSDEWKEDDDTFTVTGSYNSF